MSDRIIVVGGGVGGCRAALESAAAGLRVQLWEKNEIGGVCLNFGCIPTKTLLARSAEEDWDKLRESVEVKIGLLRTGMERRLKRAGVEIIREEFSPDKAEPGATVICAAGREWKKPEPVPGKTVFDFRDVLSLREIPEELAIVGAGVTGLEYAQIFTALGARVTVYEKCDRILPTFPQWAAERYMCACMEQGIAFELNADVAVGELKEKHVFFTAGAGKPVNVAGDYAVGDCSGRTATAYEAERDAVMAVDSILGRSRNASPAEIKVSCGKYDLVTAGEARGVSAEADCSGSAIAFMTDALDGFVRLYCEEGTGALTGAVLMLPHGAEFAGLLAALVESGAKVQDIAASTFFHPGVSECIKEAAVKLSALL